MVFHPSRVSPRLGSWAFQSVSAWTEYLDYTNSKHFTGGQSPQSILYAFESVDYRYPLFDEPGTFRTVLRNYIFKNISGKFITLEHSRNKTENESEIDLDNGGQFWTIHPCTGL